MLKINNIAFPGVGIAELQRGEQKDYKYDLVAEDGTRRAEVRARYRTYSATLGSIAQADYDRLRTALATNAESVSVTLSDSQQDVTLDARVELGDDALIFIESNGMRRWDGLTLTITTLTFSEPTGDWCNDLGISWYDADDTLLAEQDFSPDSRITEASLLEEADHAGSTVTVNAFRFGFHADRRFDLLDFAGTYAVFQQQQIARVRQKIDGARRNLGLFFTDALQVEGQRAVTIDCVDYVGLMEQTGYTGWL